MKPAKFSAVICRGHKGDAVEVPFDPHQQWEMPARTLWAGRRGFAVTAKLNGAPFASAIVPRSRKFWLLVPDEVERIAGVAAGDSVAIQITPKPPDDKAV